MSSTGKSKGCLATFTERRSRMYLAFKNPDCYAASMKKSFETIWMLMGASLELLISDSGKEFACFQEVWEAYGIPLYFAEPYCF